MDNLRARYLLSEGERCRARKFLISGAVLLLTAGATVATLLLFAPTPRELGRDDPWIWRPVDGFGFLNVGLFAIADIGLGMILWAASYYLPDRFARQLWHPVGIRRFRRSFGVFALYCWGAGGLLLLRVGYFAAQGVLAG
jgi:hypothetical protein